MMYQMFDGFATFICLMGLLAMVFYLHKQAQKYLGDKKDDKKDKAE